MELVLVVYALVGVEIGHFAHDLLLIVAEVSVAADVVTVRLSLEKGLQVEAGPRLLSGELVALAHTGTEQVETVAANTEDTSEVDAGTEPPGRNITLPLHRIGVAALGGHVLDEFHHLCFVRPLGLELFE